MYTYYQILYTTFHVITQLLLQAIKGVIRFDHQLNMQEPLSLSTTTVASVREQEWQFSRSSLLQLLYSSVPHLGLDTTAPEGTRGC